MIKPFDSKQTCKRSSCYILTCWAPLEDKTNHCYLQQKFKSWVRTFNSTQNSNRKMKISDGTNKLFTISFYPQHQIWRKVIIVTYETFPAMAYELTAEQENCDRKIRQKNSAKSFSQISEKIFYAFIRKCRLLLPKKS